MEDSTISSVKMERAPKEFYRYSNEFAYRFIEKLNMYLQLKIISTSRWCSIFQALIQGLARESMKVALALGGAIATAITGNIAITIARRANATNEQKEAG